MTLQGILDLLEARGCKPHRSGRNWMALCPTHADKNQSLSVCEKNGKILIHCFAGCPPRDVLAALGIEAQELLINANAPRRERGIVAKYDYLQEKGKLLFQVVRYEPKSFRQRRPDGGGGWIWNLNGVRRVLYRLPEVLAASKVLITEGEKDAETGYTLGFVATCNVGGAGKWHQDYSECLRGKGVVLISDADEPGRKHGQQVAASLFGKVESLKVLELPGARDLSEWVERGGTRAALDELIRNEPAWKPQRVDGGALLDRIAGYLRRFVLLSEAQKIVLAAWVVHTHSFSAFDCTPYLAITSAEKQSGKTRLLEVLDTLVANPWLTGRVTAAVLVRKIDVEHPTLLLDESDAAFRSEKEYAEVLRGILNTGYRQGGKTSCCVGQGANISFRDFSTVSPKAIAGIGKLPDTIADRAIPIRMKRMAPRERVQKFRLRDVKPESASLRKQIEEWSASILEQLRDARPVAPDALNDRQQDVAEPLLCMADAAGGEWPQKVRRALLELCCQAQASNDSDGVRLLKDIRQVMESRGVDRLSSAELTGALAEIETSPWGDWSHGKPISQAKLAHLLRPYEIEPHNVRVGDRVLKGYETTDFLDAWERHLPPAYQPSCPYPGAQNATPLQANADAAFHDFSDRHTEENVAAPGCERNREKPPGSGVAVPDVGTGVEEDL